MDREKRQRRNAAGSISLMRELQGYERQGTHLYLDEYPSRAEDIVLACMFAEDSGYMRDIISDDREHITEIHFIRIPGREER